jgi:hypothetical protein
MDVGYINRNYEPYFTKANIEDTVSNGTYAMIDSSVMEGVEKEKRTDEQENEIFAKLRGKLTNYGLPHRQVEGFYDGQPSNYSIFVIKPETVDLEKFRKKIFKLGNDFKQESIVLSTKNFVEIVYNKNEYPGKAKHEYAGKAQRGEGFENDSTPDAEKKNYTKISTSDKEYYFIGKFNAYADKDPQPSDLFKTIKL